MRFLCICPERTVTNSQKGYIISFKDNEFTIDEFPAGSESEYGITDKDIYFKTR
jgi:hypothetical protein